MPSERVPGDDAASGCSDADVPVAFDEVLERAQLAQADRAARMQLLGGVADLRAHPELSPVGEARGGVDVHAGGVDAELEGARGGGVARDDRLGVPASVASDVLDRLLDVVDYPDRQQRREVLAAPVLLGGFLDDEIGDGVVAAKRLVGAYVGADADTGGGERGE